MMARALAMPALLCLLLLSAVAAQQQQQQPTNSTPAAATTGQPRGSRRTNTTTPEGHVCRMETGATHAFCGLPLELSNFQGGCFTARRVCCWPCDCCVPALTIAPPPSPCITIRLLPRTPHRPHEVRVVGDDWAARHAAGAGTPGAGVCVCVCACVCDAVRRWLLRSLCTPSHARACVRVCVRSCAHPGTAAATPTLAHAGATTQGYERVKAVGVGHSWWAEQFCAGGDASAINIVTTELCVRSQVVWGVCRWRRHACGTAPRAQPSPITTTMGPTVPVVVGCGALHTPRSQEGKGAITVDEAGLTVKVPAGVTQRGLLDFLDAYRRAAPRGATSGGRAGTSAGAWQDPGKRMRRTPPQHACPRPAAPHTLRHTGRRRPPTATRCLPTHGSSTKPSPGLWRPRRTAARCCTARCPLRCAAPLLAHAAAAAAAWPPPVITRVPPNTRTHTHAHTHTHTHTL
jgi:hypothetical protein